MALMISFLMRSITSIALLYPALCLANLECRPEGPVVPKPTNLLNSTTFTKAADHLTTTLDQALYGDIKAGWAVENASFSLALVSLDQESPGIPIWEYHHLAEANVKGTKHLNRDSQYLVGSVTKAFAGLALIKSGLSLDDPVTDFLPQLKNSSSRVPWNTISLRSLGNHLAGLTTHYGFSEPYYLAAVFRSLGFPAIGDGSYPPCGVTGLNKGCTGQQLLQGLSDSYLINAVDERPAYSNTAFALFTLAIEEMTGKDFAAQIKDYIATPLGLKNTFPSPGNSSKAVIPPVDNSWGGDYGVNAPGGGLVSSLSDISAFAHSILSRTILSPPETRAWLKPNSITGSPSTLVGLPWEIYRPPSLLPDHPSYVPTIYAKSGGAYGYRALLALLDSHGAALVLLTAGDTTAVPHMYDAMLASFVPALDTAAREQATAELAATFASPACSKLLSNSSTNRADEACVKATLSLNSSMELTSLTRDGKDIRTAMTTLWSNALGEHVSPIEPCYNLFPTEDVTEAKLPDGRRVTRESWRMWLAPVWSDPSKSDLPGQGIGSHDCIGWQVNDWLHYGGEPLDRFVVIRDEESGDVVGIEVPFLRSGILERASSGDDDGGEGHH